MNGQSINSQCYEMKDYERLDSLNDDLHCVVRLLHKPTACMAAPEIMDVCRIALDRCHSLYQSLAVELRQQRQDEVYKEDRAKP